MEHSHRYILYLLLIIAISSLLSCVDTEPGCLDLRASNYDVVAVSECDDCCQFPSISFKVDFVDDSLSFPFSTKVGFGDDTISISSFDLAFSDFEFFENGNIYRALDSVETHPQEKDDYIIVTEGSTQRSVGQSKFLIDLDSFSFTIGYDVAYVKGIDLPENIDETSQLSGMLGTFYVDSTETYLQGRMDIEIADSLRSLEFTDIINSRKGFKEDLELELGMGWIVNVQMDIKEMLEGIVSTQTNEEMQTIISNNISKATFKE